MHEPVATRHVRFILLFASALLLLLPLAVTAHAGASPWDHYKVYQVVDPPAGPTLPIELIDQFGQVETPVGFMEWFANPVEKRLADGTGDPIFDPHTHYAWWQIQGPSLERRIDAENQFGPQTFDVFQPAYLWNPALKNELGDLPLRNHFKCYECTGQGIGIQVEMIDQFGPHSAFIADPRYFCTPAEKRVPDAQYPIVDPAQHYICYTFTPVDLRVFSVFVSDQFVYEHSTQLTDSHLLCVPTMKIDPTSTQLGTWGRLKSMYR